MGWYSWKCLYWSFIYWRKFGRLSVTDDLLHQNEVFLIEKQLHSRSTVVKREIPPRSPFFNSIYFFLWKYLKFALYETKPKDNNEWQQHAAQIQVKLSKMLEKSSDTDFITVYNKTHWYWIVLKKIPFGLLFKLLLIHSLNLKLFL